MTAIPDSVFHSRAIRNSNLSFEDDLEPMVQQQLARLKFMLTKLDLRGKRVLEFGCGSGLNCGFIEKKAGAAHVTGFDNSEGSILLAKREFPEIDVMVANACDPSLNISRGTWDIIVSFEVLEHVPDMQAFLTNVRRHLKPDGAVFISTPNREVFSSGYEPSPINREHIKELSPSEFIELMKPFFSSTELWGQRFRSQRLQQLWDVDVQAKIVQVQNGTRWKASAPTESIMHQVYKELPTSIKSIWKFLRWNLVEGIRSRQGLKNRPYGWDDFEFDRDLDAALWFCAILRP